MKENVVVEKEEQKEGELSQSPKTDHVTVPLLYSHPGTVSQDMPRIVVS